MRKMRRYILLFFFGTSSLCLQVGCRPSSVLSDSEMVDVLCDLHRAEAILQLAGYGYGHDEAVQKYNYEVLAKHGITQAQFDSSIVWYTHNPMIYRRIYPKVMSRIETMIAEDEARRALLIPDDEKPRNTLKPIEQTMLLYRPYRLN